MSNLMMVYTTPATVLRDYGSLLLESRLLDRNVSRSVCVQLVTTRYNPFPGANVTPWQLEGVLQAIQACGVERIVWKHVHTGGPASLGYDSNGYTPVLATYNVLPAEQDVLPTILLVTPAGLPVAHFYRSALVVVDATTVQVSRNATPQVHDLLLASADSAALLYSLATRGIHTRIVPRPIWHPIGYLAYYHWSGANQRLFESWLRYTGWGKLFQNYQSRITIAQ